MPPQQNQHAVNNEFEAKGALDHEVKGSKQLFIDRWNSKKRTGHTLRTNRRANKGVHTVSVWYRDEQADGRDGQTTGEDLVEGVQYSLNRKKRWTIAKEVKQQSCDAQLKVREIRRGNKAGQRQTAQEERVVDVVDPKVEDLPEDEYHWECEVDVECQRFVAVPMELRAVWQCSHRRVAWTLTDSRELYLNFGTMKCYTYSGSKGWSSKPGRIRRVAGRGPDLPGQYRRNKGKPQQQLKLVKGRAGDVVRRKRSPGKKVASRKKRTSPKEPWEQRMKQEVARQAVVASLVVLEDRQGRKIQSKSNVVRCKRRQGTRNAKRRDLMSKAMRR